MASIGTDRVPIKYFTVISHFRIKGNTDTELTMDEMEEFHNVLYKYLYETYGINFEKCTLTNICLPSLSAASTGYVST